MRIRHPNPGDWEQLLPLARAMHAESWFKSFDFQEAKVRSIFDNCLRGGDFFGLVAEQVEEIIGFFCAVTTEHFFGYDRYACDLVMYVDRRYRGGFAAVRFIRAYEVWCGHKGVKEIHIGTSTAIDTERTAGFYRKLGYHSPALGFRKTTEKCVAKNRSP